MDKMKIGPKGQVVIPKELRVEFKMYPGTTVMVKETPEGVLIEKPKENPVDVFREIARKSKGKKIKAGSHDYVEELEQRWKRAGLK